MPLPLAERTVGAVGDAMLQGFLTYWAGRTEVGHDNKKLDPKALDEFVRHSIVYTPGLSGPAGIESGRVKRFRRQGIIFVSTFVRSGTGQQRSNELVDEALLYFESVVAPEGVWYRNPGPGANSDDGAWYQVSVTAEFTYDTLRA